MPENPIEQLKKVLSEYSEVLIIPHNDPDPDAIASATALRYLLGEMLGLSSRIAYQGIVGRAENKALVRYLKNPLQRLNFSELRQGIPIALVDTQPGAGNNPLPTDVNATIVIDHHTWRKASATARFVDVRTEMGSTTTILVEYLRRANLEVHPTLATALFYGIKVDTMGLSREASPEDVEAYFYLLPQIDIDAITQIENAQVPTVYFKSFTSALQAAKIYDHDTVISFIGKMAYPDLGAEIADLLLRLQDVQWVICMGVYENELILSVRSRNRQIRAGSLVREIVGGQGTAGGHGTMAGGHIPLHEQDGQQLATQLTNKALLLIKGEEDIASTNLV
ncbi:MAG: DHH family phosphoesterase [Chloroflexota bacterium]